MLGRVNVLFLCYVFTFLNYVGVYNRSIKMLLKQLSYSDEITKSSKISTPFKLNILLNLQLHFYRSKM